MDTLAVSPNMLRLWLESPSETDRLGRMLATNLTPGDALLLSGPIGAGKSHLARSIIRERLAACGAPSEDIPSPTYTLVQTYDCGGIEIWHADLYRLAGPDEIPELGLDLAFEDGICLVEWPDRLGEFCPSDALTITFDLRAPSEGRLVTLQWRDARWTYLSTIISDFPEARVGPER